MAWSTREVAELAGVSLRAVRHYHEVGLLPEPSRRANGYKSYGVQHLVRLVRIKRFTDLGLSLTRISELDDTDETSDEALRDLDTELAATIERLQRARDEIGRQLRDRAPDPLPAEAPETERGLLVVMSQLAGPDGREALAEWMRDYEQNPVDIEFENLPADADDASRADLAARMLPYSVELRRRNKGRILRGKDVRGGREHAKRTIQTALRDIYNPAQLDVLSRVSALMPPEETGGT
ncbi:MerR family transcriptional regulator [Pseudonocardiaceae bacterium YIM PH 21723]|nr:MerR family transcriptional regulator [Pseudonocardiaceae bacterium YIM PH 21723]